MQAAPAGCGEWPTTSLTAALLPQRIPPETLHAIASLHGELGVPFDELVAIRAALSADR